MIPFLNNASFGKISSVFCFSTKQLRILNKRPFPIKRHSLKILNFKLVLNYKDAFLQSRDLRGIYLDANLDRRYILITNEQVDRIFSVNPVIFHLLKESPSPHVARDYILAYLEESSRFLHKSIQSRKSLEYSLQLSCLNAFREIISVRSEKLTKFNIVKELWFLVRKQFDQVAPDISTAFVEDLYHILLGMIGKSRIYDNARVPEFTKLKNRAAAIARSQELDERSNLNLVQIRKYPTGLQDDIIATREENKERILHCLKATSADWDDYHWHLRHIIRTSEQLGALVQLTEQERQAIDLARVKKIPFGITPYYVSLMDYETHRTFDHAVRAQVIPPPYYVQALAEHRADACYELDFMREHDTSPVDLVTRRYPHIAILKPYNTCSQICVYCQRNWEIDDVLMPQAMATKEKIIQAVEWLKEHSAITEILITGGDPLVMNDAHLSFVLHAVADIEHVERIRLGTRIPVVLPQRITDALIDLIASFHIPGRREVAMVTHYEHCYEVTPESMAAVQKFRERGISMYNQVVFTMENSRRFELVALRRLLRLIGVDSYYAFNAKGKEETKNYRVPMARLQQEVKEEARLMPGLVRTDEPVYNVPRLGKNYLRAEQNHSLLTILPNGSRVYEFHPWEKNLTLADTYIDVDVPIYDYLQELSRRGENTADYHSIWYYF